MPAKIEDYALIGDCETAALVSRHGAIDWLCWPRFDSGAVFAALLGTEEHGSWSLAPAVEPTRIRRRYVDGTLILRTEFECEHGAVALIDFMRVRQGHSELVRIVEGLSGAVPMAMQLRLRFDYGSIVPWVTQLEDGGGIRAVAGPDMVVLRAPVPLQGSDHTTIAGFTAHGGQRIPFVMTYAPSHLGLPEAQDPLQLLDETAALWLKWSSRMHYAGPWKEAVSRSLITLKALTYQPTGGIVAAPTTSLPERFGGVRNWDYRYCWLRDATLSLLALMNAGYYDEAAAWRSWLERATAGSPDQIQIMYGLAGERRLTECEAAWLPGYEGAAPVRIGNAAAGQLQLDVYGEVMDALYQARRGGLTPNDTSWGLQSALTAHLEGIWQQPDEGIWEVRGGRRHFTFSKVMAWVALDRAIRSIEEHGLEGPLDHWREIRTRIHADVCAHGVDARRGCFVQSYGGRTLDASLLQIPLTGFLPADDPRVQATVDAIEQDLVVDGFVRRYDTSAARDGLPGREGAFLACSFWLADNYILLGRHAQARALFERLLAVRNDLGLLAEEYDPITRRQAGNFPQAFSHIALTNTAFNLARASGPARQRAEGGQPAAEPAAAR